MLTTYTSPYSSQGTAYTAPYLAGGSRTWDAITEPWNAMTATWNELGGVTYTPAYV